MWVRTVAIRLTELSGREGARFWFGRQEVHLENTRPVRRKALICAHTSRSLSCPLRRAWAPKGAISPLRRTPHLSAPREASPTPLNPISIFARRQRCKPQGTWSFSTKETRTGSANGCSGRVSAGMTRCAGLPPNCSQTKKTPQNCSRILPPFPASSAQAPTFHRLFTEFVRQAPSRAVELARCILRTPPDNAMAAHLARRPAHALGRREIAALRVRA
jgi:hypothetical protein